MNKIIRSPLVQTATRVLSAKSKVKHGIVTNKNSSEPTEEVGEKVIQNESLDSEERVNLASKQLEELEATLEQEKLAARKEGFDQGYLDGKTKAYAELKDKMELMAELLQEIDTYHEKQVQQQEGMLLEIIMLSVNKIVGDVSKYKDITRNVIDKVVQEVVDKQSLTIKVSPLDYEWLSQESFPQYPGIRFVAEESIQFGGCEVETMGGVIDARFERQLQIFNNSLLDKFRKRQGEQSAE